MKACKVSNAAGVVAPTAPTPVPPRPSKYISKRLELEERIQKEEDGERGVGRDENKGEKW